MKRRRINLDEALAILEGCAMRGERAPLAGTDGLTSTLTGDLARAGKIRIDIYPHNWRVITIMSGKHKGKSTAPAPNPNWRPYLTLPSIEPSKPAA